MKRYIAIFLTIICILMLSACGKEADHTVKIELESNPEIGMEWRVSQSEELFDIECSYTEEKVNGEIVGRYLYTLIPKDEGMNTVKFSYSQKGESYAVREYEYAFIVSEGMFVSRGDEVGSGPAPVIN